jgi:hypothetical protein
MIGVISGVRLRSVFTTFVGGVFGATKSLLDNDCWISRGLFMTPSCEILLMEGRTVIRRRISGNLLVLSLT